MRCSRGGGEGGGWEGWCEEGGWGLGEGRGLMTLRWSEYFVTWSAHGHYTLELPSLLREAPELPCPTCAALKIQRVKEIASSVGGLIFVDKT